MNWQIDKTTLVKWALEMMIVFCGVYLAFWLNSYSQQIAEDKRKVEYCEVFILELRYLSNFLERDSARLDSIRQSFQSELAAGNRPLPKPIKLSFDFEGLIIRAVSQDRSFEALGISLIGKIAIGNNAVLALNNRYTLYQSYTREILLPNLDEPTGEYYGEDGKLKEKYRWYMNMLSEIIAYARNLKMVIDDRAIPDVQNIISKLQ